MDGQVGVSMLSVAFIGIPLVILTIFIALVGPANGKQWALLYGFTIFFGWITAIIFGMTFKTLPFIVWNKVYHNVAGLGKTPNPKDLFSNRVFVANALAYLAGFFVFGYGILRANVSILNIGAVFLVIAAVLYNLNVFKVLFHKAKLK